MAERRLNIVQDRQQSPFNATMAVKNVLNSHSTSRDAVGASER
jgi:hypothetical protein